MKTALVTGGAGFIGSACVHRLIEQGYRVTNVDAMTDYYDPALKEARLAQFADIADFRFVKDWIETPGLLKKLFEEERFDTVIHLAAQAGVRYSIENPRTYLEGNIVGTFELLEAARLYPPRHMLLASTSSAYGANTEMPFIETMNTDHPMSFYAATKKATEAMAHSYAHLFSLPVTMFRFFTVYGPWGRPDMALFKFTKAILDDEPIDVYNFGDMKRDFTYIDDLVDGIIKLVDAVPETGKPIGQKDSLSPVAPWRIVNLGNSSPIQLDKFIQAIEESTSKTAIRNLMPMQAGDVPATWADTTLLEDLTGSTPSTDIRVGVGRFVEWYRNFYEVNSNEA